MHKTKISFTLTVLASSLMVAYGPAWSAETDEVAAMTKPSSEVSIGVGHWSDDRPKMGRFDAMRDGGAYLLLDADVQMRDDATGTWKNLYINSLGTENREIRLEYLQQGSIGGSIEYTQFQSKAPYTIYSNNLNVRGQTQTQGANIPNTAIGSGADYLFGMDRSKLGATFYKNLMPNLDLNARFSTEDKEGNRITSNGSANFVADLIDYTTRKAEVTLDYTGKELQLSGGMLGSWYKNNNDAGFVLLTNGTVRMTQPLDNSSWQAFVSGSYSFTPTTQGTFKLAYTRDTQDESLPTASIRSASYGNIPKLDGRVDTTLLQLGLTARPLPQLSVVASLRYQDVDDKTDQYTSVRSTDNTANIAVKTTPYSYETTSGKLEGTYRLPDGYSLTAGIDYSEQDRTVYTGISETNGYVPLRNDLDETTYRLQVRKNLSETLNGSLTYLQSDRDGSRFSSSTSTQAGTQFVSPVNAADRERQKLRLSIDWAPIEKLDLQFNFETAQDNYGTNAQSHGLHEGEAKLYNLDASYQLNDSWQLTGWYSYNTNDAHFINAGPGTTVTLISNQNVKKQNDIGEAFGLNLVGKLTGQAKVGAELTWSKDTTEFDQRNSNGTPIRNFLNLAVVAPDIYSKALRLNLFADYAVQKNADLRFNLIHEKWETDDWQWKYSTGLPFQYGNATTDGTTVISKPKQDATFVGVRYVYKFQ